MPKDTLTGDGLEGRLPSKPSLGVGEWMHLQGVGNGSENTSVNPPRKPIRSIFFYRCIDLIGPLGLDIAT